MSVTSEMDRILDYCRVRAPQASQDGIAQCLYEAMLDFFQTTSAWKTAVTFSTIVNTQVYDLVPEGPGSPIRLVGVWDLNGIEWAAMMPLGITIVPSIPPAVSTHPAVPGTIQLIQPPSVSQGMIAQFVMNVALPTDGNNLPEVPDWTLPMYSQEFIEGTLARLLTQPKKPYTDMSSGALYWRQFNDGMAKVRTSVQRANTYGKQAWVYPQRYRSYGQKGGVSVGNAWMF